MQTTQWDFEGSLGRRREQDRPIFLGTVMSLHIPGSNGDGVIKIVTFDNVSPRQPIP